MTNNDSSQVQRPVHASDAECSENLTGSPGSNLEHMINGESQGHNQNHHYRIQKQLPVQHNDVQSKDEDYNEADEGSSTPDGNHSGDSGENADSNQGPELNNKRIILQRFTIYNSITTMYIVGSNAKESLFRILEIGKDSNGKNLSIIEDKNYFYTRKDMVELLNGLDESVDGGIHKIAQGYGLLGLIRFTKGYYLSIITKCSQVAILGGHYIYHTDETKLIPLDINYRRPEKYSDEERLLSIFKYLDLGKTFYFSYAYDITNTLQTNFVRNKKLASQNKRSTENQLKEQIDHSVSGFEHNERFVWNNLLLKPILDNPDIATYEWFQPIIHGFIDQANISIYGKKFYITIIARRSHHYAGARFLKRGVNDKGNVANEIETEQIVSDMLISSFHDPKYGYYNNPRFSSFVQHRGSIPLYWTQDLNRLPKPPIEINLMDPFYQSSALHFNNLFQRYGSPVIILNLIKTKEKQPRESKLNLHFCNCISYLNQFLPKEHKLHYYSFDMSKHSKKNLDVITPLQKIASKSIEETGFFQNGKDIASTKLQKGILRTNCIDCLDRTNAAQFIVCKEALMHQLKSLGLIGENRTLEYDSDLINILTEMFHDHGDTIAVQYGGSNLVNTMDSYRRINQWSSHTRDILNSVKRIYSNSFMDSIRQEAINLFLGNYIYNPNKPKLWELQNDYYLHNNISIDNLRIKPSYILWFTERYLSKTRFELRGSKGDEEDQKKSEPISDYNDNWYNECYVPRKYQSLNEVFQYNMNSNARYFPSNINNEPDKYFDYSPFESRKIKSDELQPNMKSLGPHKKVLKGDYSETQNNSDSSSDSRHSAYDFNKPKESIQIDSAPVKAESLNPKKLKSFLVDKIEKLGYNANLSQQNDSAKNQTSYQGKPTGGFLSSSFTPDLVVEPRLDKSDEELYSNQSNIHQLLSRFQESSSDYYTTVKTKADDYEAYKYYSKFLRDDTIPRAHGEIREQFRQAASIDIQDIHTYRRYLGIDFDKDTDFATEDEYFN